MRGSGGMGGNKNYDSNNDRDGYGAGEGKHEIFHLSVWKWFQYLGRRNNSPTPRSFNSIRLNECHVNFRRGRVKSST